MAACSGDPKLFDLLVQHGANPEMERDELTAAQRLELVIKQNTESLAGLKLN